MVDEMTLMLDSPITDEQWDDIMDVDFDKTDKIYFHTKNGKEVEFIKRKTGRWIADGQDISGGHHWMHCSVCNHSDVDNEFNRTPYCPWCGAKMEGEQE